MRKLSRLLICVFGALTATGMAPIRHRFESLYPISKSRMRVHNPMGASATRLQSRNRFAGRRVEG